MDGSADCMIRFADELEKARQRGATEASKRAKKATIRRLKQERIRAEEKLARVKKESDKRIKEEQARADKAVADLSVVVESLNETSANLSDTSAKLIDTSAQLRTTSALLERAYSSLKRSSATTCRDGKRNRTIRCADSKAASFFASGTFSIEDDQVASRCFHHGHTVSITGMTSSQ